MKSRHRSKVHETSYTDAGVAVDGCSTLIDTTLGMSESYYRCPLCSTNLRSDAHGR